MLEVKDFSFEKLANFCSEVFGGEEEKIEFWQRMTVDFSGSVGFQKEMDKQVWGMYSEIYLRYR